MARNKRPVLGCVSIIIGLTLLSLELYGLKFIQALDMVTRHEAWGNAIDYLNESSVLAAVLSAVLLIVFGAALICLGTNSRKK